MKTDRPIQLLMIEDNPVAARLSMAILEREPIFRVKQAISLAEAMDLLRNAAFDVALLDLYLPDAEGLESFRILHAFSPELPVVILSGLDDHSIALKAVQEGAQDFLVKGEMDAELLHKSVRHAIERKKIERKLKESEERYALAARGANDGIWDWDVRNQEFYFSPRFLSMMGREPEEAPQSLEQWSQFLHPDDAPAFLDLIQKHVEGTLRQLRIEYRVQHPDGQYRWMLIRGEAQRGEDGRAQRIAGSQTDITDFRLIDTLTGLPNRLLFSDRLEQAYIRFQNNSSRGFALIYLDINRFGRLNESFGIRGGDAILGDIARRLKSALSIGDTISRPNSDEFLILLEDVDPGAGIAAVQNRLKGALHRPLYFQGEELHIDFGAGVVFSELREDGPESLIRDAHSALQKAKRKGGSVFEVYCEEKSETSREKLQLEMLVRKALDSGQFRLFYQPQMDLRSNRITGFEALIRWHHPDLGIIAPDRFLPVAEDIGLIGKIGEWTLNQAITQLQEWYDQGLRVRVAVNLSPTEFRARTVADYLRKELKRTTFPPGALEMEFTETVALENVEQTIEELEEIHRMGLRVAVDDFGTGFSSLTYLKKFPVNSVKIDREFVMSIPHNSDDAAIVSAILAMGKSLGLEVVAEGVETEEQLNFLRERNCEYAQGYLISRPLPAAEARTFLENMARHG
ncbi:MAG: EAL domain-containing protein [Leptospiraceae bacterium]|nr:EAL domain-containing protein [Leptospiraceae bacterium]